MITHLEFRNEHLKPPCKHLRTHLSGKDELNHQNDQPPTATRVNNKKEIPF